MKEKIGQLENNWYNRMEVDKFPKVILNYNPKGRSDRGRSMPERPLTAKEEESE